MAPCDDETHNARTRGRRTEATTPREASLAIFIILQSCGQGVSWNADTHTCKADVAGKYFGVLLRIHLKWLKLLILLLHISTSLRGRHGSSLGSRLGLAGLVHPRNKHDGHEQEESHQEVEECRPLSLETEYAESNLLCQPVTSMSRQKGRR